MIPDQSRRDRMVAMYQRGVGCGDIAREFGVKPNAVRMSLTRAGVYEPPQRRAKRPNPKTEAAKADLAEFVANGGTVSGWATRTRTRNSWAHQLWAMIRRDLGAQAQ
jgi:transposase